MEGSHRKSADKLALAVEREELEAEESVGAGRVTNQQLATRADKARKERAKEAANAGGKNAEALEEARRKMESWLEGATGPAASAKILAELDSDGDGVIRDSDLEDFLEEIDLGNWITRGIWVDGIMEHISSEYGGSSSEFSAEALQNFVTDIGL